MTLKALLFDVDGTLADTERDGHRIAFNQTFAAFGLDWNWDVNLYGKLLAVTGGKERIHHFVETAGIEKPAGFEQLVADLHREKTRRYTELLRSGGIPMRKGVARIIKDALQQGLRLSVVTTTTLENVTTLLACSLAPDAVKWFDVIAAGDIVPRKKPAPDIYFWALEKLGLSPADCLALEDSENGFMASRGANVKTLITVNDYTREQKFPGAAAVLSDLGEPESPFTLYSGNAHGKTFADIDLLHAWHQS